MPEPDTVCGYGLADVRKSLRDAIDRRERRAANRWTAELVATPGAVGSLWSAYWLAWAAAQGAGSASPTIPILLKQAWGLMTEAAHGHASMAASQSDAWAAFRNDPQIRASASEMTARLLGQPHQTPVVWPSREIALYDVGKMREETVPPSADGPVILRVWQRGEDSMELRVLAGRWLDALQTGNLREALSAVFWTLMTQVQQGLTNPLKCAERGPASLPPKARASPLWYWLDLGRACILSRSSLHRGWATMHAAIAEAFKLHYKRWTATDRMRVLLAWTLQIRATFVAQEEALWAAPAVSQTLAEIDLPYRELAAEKANPNDTVIRHEKAPDPEKVSKEQAKDKIAAKMADADAAIMAALGLSEADF
jgi:hypothetical protein